MDSLRLDIRTALRSLAKRPGLTIAAIVCLALGIGANATMFGIVDTLMFKPPAGVEQPDQVVRIYFVSPPGKFGPGGPFTRTGFGTYEALRDRMKAAAQVAAYFPSTTSLGRGESARSAHVVFVTASFFRALETHPALGRFFTPDEERNDGTKTVVLDYSLWKGRFGGDSSVLGTTVDVGGQPYTVIGVAPRDFTGVDLKAVDAWLPIGAAGYPLHEGNGSRSYWLQTIARIAPSASRDVAAAQAAAAYNADNTDTPMSGKVTATFAPLQVGRGPTVDQNAKIALWLAGVSLIVLLIACANVANLLLARAASRTREVAIRLSLGSGRWRLVRQLLIEGMLVSAAGAGAALIVSVWSGSFVRAVLIPDVPLLGHAISGRTLLFAAVVAVACGVLCSLAPAWFTYRSNLNALLKGDVLGGGRHRFTLHRVLAAGQVALTVVLLTGAGLFIVSLRNARSIDLGIDADRVLYAGVGFRRGEHTMADATALYSQMADAVNRLPGVRATGISYGEPFRSGFGAGIVVPGVPESIPTPGTRSSMGRAVSLGYFDATGTRIDAGHAFTAAEHSATSRALMINEVLAHKYWPHGSPVGACVHMWGDEKGECYTVVGVVAYTPFYSITQPDADQIFFPIEAYQAQFGDGAPEMIEIRTSGDPSALIPAVRHAMESVDPSIPFPVVQPLTDIIDPQYRPWKLGASMFSAFGLLALLLAAVGLYGVLAYAVTQRTRELGIRAALGAGPSRLRRSVLVSGVTTAAIGALLGIAGALAGGKAIAALLDGVSPRDPWVLGVAALTLVVVSLFASYFPARRATRVDPMIALRVE